MLISRAAATRALASPYIYTSPCLYANLGGCGYLGAGKSMYIYIYIQVLCANLGGCGYSGAGKSMYIYIIHVCMLISRAAATQALAISLYTYIYIYILTFCMLISRAAASQALALHILTRIHACKHTCINTMHANLGGCGCSGSGKSRHTYIHVCVCQSRGLRLLRRWPL